METGTYINFTSSEILLGTPEDTPPLFYLFLITTIVNLKVPCTPNIDGLIRKVNNINCIEKNIAVYNQKWFITNDEVDPI